jgi:hypothetical protein
LTGFFRFVIEWHGVPQKPRRDFSLFGGVEILIFRGSTKIKQKAEGAWIPDRVRILTQKIAACPKKCESKS